MHTKKTNHGRVNRGAKKPTSKSTPKKPTSTLLEDLDETLKEIDKTSGGLGVDKGGGNGKSRGRGWSHWSKKRKIITSVIVGLLLVLLIGGGYFTYRVAKSGERMLDGSMLDIIRKEPLKKDQFGRTNVLVFGTSEDNVGHSGALLADSILILSLDQETGDSNMMSIPRDLWVDYINPSCSVGREGKINATYMCALEANQSDENLASLDFAKKASEVIGTDVQYYARVNYSVVRDLVDSLGGVTVTIESEDPRGILDRNFDKQCPNGPYTCHFVKYPNGPAQLDGEHALALSRARNAKGGYGLPGGNFDREKNQQRILKAVQKKALSTGTLANPSKVLKLVDSLGDNINSNLKVSELQTVIGVAQNISPDSIKTLDLRKPGDGKRSLVTIGNYMEQSIVQPVLGLKDYSGIQEFVAESLSPKPKDSNPTTSSDR